MAAASEGTGASVEERRSAVPLPAGLINVWINQGQTGYGIYFKNVRAIAARGCVSRRHG